MCEYVFSMLIVGLVNVAPDVFIIQALDHDKKLVECAFLIHRDKIAEMYKEYT